MALATPNTTIPLLFMGRKLGTYDSVDIYPESGMKIFSFEPDAKCKLPAGDIFIDLGRGTAKYGDAGPELDLIDAISPCDKFTEAEFAAVDKLVEDSEQDEDDDAAGPVETQPGDK